MLNVKTGWLLVCALLCLSIGSAPLLAGDYNPPRFEGRTGEIVFENESRYSVTITLWHPDNGEAYATWKVQSGTTRTLWSGGKPIIVGDDWGVQLGDSKVRPLSRFAKWDRATRTFKVSVDLFHDR